MRATPLLVLSLLACDPSRPTRNRTEDACLELGPLSADTTCAPGPCGVEVQQRGCRASLLFRPFDGTASCPDPIDVELDPGGRIRVADTSAPCQAIEPVTGALTSLECRDLSGTCRVDLLPKPGPAFTATTLAVVERPIYFPEPEHCAGGTCSGEPLDFYSPWGGDLSAITFVDSVAWIVGRPAPTGFDCAGTEPSIVHFYALADLAPAGTATVPACLDQIRADPSAPGEVIGLTSRPANGSPQVVRLDHAGRVIAGQVIDFPLSALITPFRPIALEVRPDWIYGLWVHDLNQRNAYSILVRLDRRTLAVDRVIEVRGDHHRGVIFGATTMWLIDRGGGSGKADAIRLDTLANAGSISLDATRPGSNDGAQGVVLDGDKSLVVSTTGSSGGIYYQQDDARRLSFPYESDAAPFAISAMPGDANLAVGLTARGPTREASIALYSPAGVRFLPGQIPIGVGAVLAIEPDRDGRLWALLPWAGQVVVLQRRP